LGLSFELADGRRGGVQEVRGGAWWMGCGARE
jgi:hypothetical protein